MTFVIVMVKLIKFLTPILLFGGGMYAAVILLDKIGRL